ncbi:ras GTPase [Balamuthia mandrillaris]
MKKQEEEVLALCRDARLEELKQLVEHKKVIRRKLWKGRSSSNNNKDDSSAGDETALTELDRLLLHSDPMEGRSLLQVAAMEDQRETIRYLLSDALYDQDQPQQATKRNKLVNHQDFAGWTALHGAASRGHLQACLLLLEEGQAEARLTSKDSATALHYLMKQTYPKGQKHLLRRVVEEMLKVGADLNAVNVNQETALHLACWKGDKRSAFVLLKLGANMMLFSKSGETCLHYAVRNGHLEVVRLLVQNGADVSAVGNNGSASDIARECQHTHIADYIDKFFTIRQLPDEILLYIFSFLHTEQHVLCVTHVCKHFRRIGSEPILWEPFLRRADPSKLKATTDWKKAFLDHRHALLVQKEKQKQEALEREKLLRAPLMKRCDPATYGFDFMAKVVIIGDSGVGKSHLVTRLVSGTYTDSYFPSFVEFEPFTIMTKTGQTLKLQIWEPMLRFRNYNFAPIYRRAAGVLFCFDVTNRESFDNVRKWMQEVDRYAMENVQKIVVATKADLLYERVVTFDEAKEFADEFGVECVETSAKYDDNVIAPFEQLADLIMTNVLEEDQNPQGQTLLVSPPRKKKSKKFLFF